MRHSKFSQGAKLVMFLHSSLTTAYIGVCFRCFSGCVVHCFGLIADICSAESVEVRFRRAFVDVSLREQRPKCTSSTRVWCLLQMLMELGLECAWVHNSLMMV